jgi:gamma-glutamylcyclotransferase (GGCT)/AIG2-like uncharacterized protein YtfP
MPRVFVYGTLKRGLGNHRLMLDATFLGDATIERLSCWEMGGGLPIAWPISFGFLRGEVYEVTDEQLQTLDILEQHPEWYERVPMQAYLSVYTGEFRATRLGVWVYVRAPDRQAQWIGSVWPPTERKNYR